MSEKTPKSSTEDKPLAHEEGVDEIVKSFLTDPTDKFGNPEQEKRVEKIIADYLGDKVDVVETADQILREAQIFNKESIKKENKEEKIDDFGLWLDKISDAKIKKATNILIDTKKSIREYAGSGSKADLSKEEKMEGIRDEIKTAINSIMFLI